MGERERRTGKPGVLQSLGPQRVRPDSATEQQMLIGCETSWVNILTTYRTSVQLCSKQEREKERDREPDLTTLIRVLGSAVSAASLPPAFLLC